MKRRVVWSSGFVRASRRTLRKNPQLAEHLRTVLELLAEDPFNPKLKAHKLQGALKDFWSISAGYDLRVVFEFVKDEGVDAILLHTLGTHDDVY